MILTITIEIQDDVIDMIKADGGVLNFHIDSATIKQFLLASPLPKPQEPPELPPPPPAEFPSKRKTVMAKYRIGQPVYFIADGRLAEIEYIDEYTTMSEAQYLIKFPNGALSPATESLIEPAVQVSQ